MNGGDVALLAEAMVLAIGGYLGGTYALDAVRGWQRRRRMVAWRPERHGVRVVGVRPCTLFDWREAGL